MRMRMRVILDSLFARPGSAPIYGVRRDESSGTGLVPQYLTSFVFYHTIRLMIIPFLTSAQVTLTTELPVDQPGNMVVSSLVLFLCQARTFTNNVIYCFTLLATQPKLVL